MSSRNNNSQRGVSQFINVTSTNNVNGSNTNQNPISRLLINNSNMMERITRIPSLQITSNLLEEDFFNGAKFNNNNDFESLILPSGCFYFV